VHRVSEDAAIFNRKLAQLSERLAAKDIVVSRLHADWPQFRELHVERGHETQRYNDECRLDPMHAIGPEVLRFFWDGLEGLLTVQASPTRPLSAPNEWKFECGKSFDRSGNEALQFVEQLLTKRFSS
jgi:hypothetical protein